MSIIRFIDSDCSNCYKCIRECSVKAIAMLDDHVQILEKECVLCGRCYAICSQSNKSIKSSLDEVKGYLKKKQKVYVSLDSSYVAIFNGATVGQMFTALKKLGFTMIEESTVGAAAVSEAYSSLARKGEMKNIITSHCPTVVSLIEKHYPSLIPYLAPVVSPMMAHAKMMREMYGPRIKVVYIGPCIARKAEAYNNNLVNAVLTFDELQKMLDEAGINVSEQEESGYESHNVVHRHYPAYGGVLKTLNVGNKTKYTYLTVDGMDRCHTMLTDLTKNDLSGYFVELSACIASCLGSPILETRESFLTWRDLVRENAKRTPNLPAPITEGTKVDVGRSFNCDIGVEQYMPSEEAIAEVLAQISIMNNNNELNCGTCGYNTCRNKAIAVLQGKTDLKMCLPYMRKKAESLSNYILDNTPDATFLADSNLKILEYNHAAATMFDLFSHDYKDTALSDIINIDGFEDAKNNETHIWAQKVSYPERDIITEQKVIYLDETSSFLVMLKDITQKEAEEQRTQLMRRETAAIAQKVIDKQMRVAQEIASLLGETTGESKAALLNLQKYIQADEISAKKEEK